MATRYCEMNGGLSGSSKYRGTEAIDGSFLLLSAFHKLALNGLELELSAEEDNLRF